jgi:hypothetical protein
MNATEVRALLTLIETYDRTTFRPEAVALWGEALRRIAYQDAEAAVHAIFRTSGHDERGAVRRLLPADVRRPAEAIAESRYRRAAQRAIGTRAPAAAAEPSAAQLAARLAARQVAEAAVARYRERVAA